MYLLVTIIFLFKIVKIYIIYLYLIEAVGKGSNLRRVWEL